MNVCGNGVREPGEQCDDGGVTNLDGCDAGCQFEQDLRSNWLKLQDGLDGFCGNANRLGTAIASIALGQIQISLDQGITNGTSGFVVEMLDLASPTGMDDPSLLVGAMTALPVAGAGYDGQNDLDWWYTVNPASIDAARSPIDKIPGSIAGNLLTAGPGSMTLPINFFPSATTSLRLASAKLQVPIGASFAPSTAVGGLPPGHLPSENLDPALASFASAGQTDVNLSGKLCGDITAKSLAQAPIPPELVVGMYACLEGYTMSSSFLDLLVSGCTIDLGGGPIPVINPIQPDKADPLAPVAGAGAPYTFAVDALKVVSSCTDTNGVAASLAACIDAAAYSSYFRFVLGRVLLK